MGYQCTRQLMTLFQRFVKVKPLSVGHQCPISAQGKRGDIGPNMSQEWSFQYYHPKHFILFFRRETMFIWAVQCRPILKWPSSTGSEMWVMSCLVQANPKVAIIYWFRNVSHLYDVWVNCESWAVQCRPILKWPSSTEWVSESLLHVQYDVEFLVSLELCVSSISNDI